MSNYVQNFQSRADVIEQYAAPSDALKGAVVHLAWYGYGSYQGSSLVIFEKDGKLYEVNGSHCSCNGLEGQWEPEETTWKALSMRDFDHGYYDGEEKCNTFAFAHPWDERDGGDFKKWAENFVREQLGEEHVKDLVWEECKVYDD